MITSELLGDHKSGAQWVVGLVVTVSVLSIGLPMVVFSRAILVLVFLQVLLFAVSEVIKSDIL